MSDLRELLRRVESATGPDRKLDAEIDAALFGGTASHTLQGREFSTHRSYDAGTVFRPARPCVVYIKDSKRAEPFTASVDAALALAERMIPGVWWLIGKGQTRAAEPPYGAQLLFGSDQVLGEGESLANPALALCAAVLKSKLTETDHAG